ncbi:hypothetical protein ACWDR3_42345 [Streptomyces sp. NPDC001002]
MPHVVVPFAESGTTRIMRCSGPVDQSRHHELFVQQVLNFLRD